MREGENMDKLDLILQKLESLEARLSRLEEVQQAMAAVQQAMAAGQKELYHLSSAIRDRQEETDAKLEALAMDVNRLHGKVEAQGEKLITIYDELQIFRGTTKVRFRQLEVHMHMVDSDLDKALTRVELLEAR
jgi:septal ring factor EnvC (AmiA/AmiB activator)